MLKRAIAGLLVSCLLAACGGGSAGSGTVPVLPPSRSAGPLSVTVAIAIPGTGAHTASLRGPRYVSTSTNSARISVNGGTAVVANLSAGSAACTSTTGGGRSCSIPVSATPGNDTFAVSLYASSDGSGAALSQNTVPATIVAGTANTVTMTLDGVVASIVLALANGSPTVGAKATIPLTVTLKDASGATIVGGDPLANPVTLTDSDTSGATTLSSTTVSTPSQGSAVTVAYSGGALSQATFGATATNVPAANVTRATLTPSSFADWPTYAYDNARSGFNPYTAAITPASIAKMKIAWQVALNGSTQTQPIVATNVAGHAVLLIVANYAIAEAYDGLTGKFVWKTTLPTQNVQDCGTGGISGTAVYDKALGAVFMAAGDGNGAPNHVKLYRLDVATGVVQQSVDVTPSLLAGEANYAHSGLTLANGRIYLGTGSDCEGNGNRTYTSWRGRVVAVDPAGMNLLATFYTTWGQGGNYGGGGVWAWGGVSVDASGNVFFSSGNTETAGAPEPSPPFVAAPSEYAGLGEHLIETSSDLGTVVGSNYPGFNYTIGYGDLDYTGVPVVYQPPVAAGCGEMTATQGKGGTLVLNNASGLGVVKTFNLSVPSGAAYSIGNPAYSPVNNMLYAAITSAGNGSAMLAPGLAAIDGCGNSMAWHAAFGPDSTQYTTGEYPRSAPTVTAGGVVFMGTPCTNDGNGGCGAPGAVNGALWAVDGTAGTVLNNGKPLLLTGDAIRMAPSVDGLWMWVLDGSGNFYGLTIDPSVQAITARPAIHVTSQQRFHGKD